MATRDPLIKHPVKKVGGKGRRSTVLLDQATIEAVCLAEMGKNNQAIRTLYKIDFTDGQFQYRLTRAKQVAGFAHGDGFRKAWREGRSAYEEVVRAMMDRLQRDYEKKIIPQIEKATPKVAPTTEAAA
jgi:hypothetical protein